MKSLLTWTERRLLRLFRKLSNRQNFHLKAEMFSFHSKYFVYRKLKRAPQKLSFCFKCPDTGTVRILGNILYSTTNGPGKCVSAENFNKNNKNSDICLSMLTGVQNRCSAADSLRASKNNEEQAHLIHQVFFFGILIHIV